MVARKIKNVNFVSIPLDNLVSVVSTANRRNEMALRIIKATEPMTIQNIVLTIYAQPGLGKTSLSFTADKPLMLDFDRGSYRSQNRGDAVPVHQWKDVEAMTATDLEPYHTIIVDTAGRALDALSTDIINGNPKMGKNGNLSLQGYGELKGRFSRWQNFLRSLGKDLVLVCHMEEQKNGDDLLERIDAQGSSKNEIYKSSDAMCRIQILADGSRVLNFDPREGGFGKNPAQLPKLPFVHPAQNPRFLADVIAQIKESINRITEAQAREKQESEAWQAAVNEIATLEEVNVLVKLAVERQLDAAKKGLLSSKASELGFVFDKASNAYVEGVKA